MHPSETSAQKGREHVSQEADTPSVERCIELSEARTSVPRRQTEKRYDEAITAHLSRLSQLEAENRELRERLKPNMFWDADDGENGCDDLETIVEVRGETSLVMELHAAVIIPKNIWVAADYSNEVGAGWVITQHETAEEAQAELNSRQALNKGPDHA